MALFWQRWKSWQSMESHFRPTCRASLRSRWRSWSWRMSGRINVFLRVESGRTRIPLVEETVKVCHLSENGCSAKGRNTCMYSVRDIRKCVKNTKIKRFWGVGFEEIYDFKYLMGYIGKVHVWMCYFARIFINWNISVHVIFVFCFSTHWKNGWNDEENDKGSKRYDFKGKHY